jgi:hypothetical protein
MGYNRSGHRRTKRLKRIKKHTEQLARKAAKQITETATAKKS